MKNICNKIGLVSHSVEIRAIMESILVRGDRGLVAAIKPPIHYPSARLTDWRKLIRIRPLIR